ncbi:DNA-binding response regulator [Parapedobacter pyrenivorans]|uniref:DNA-binding response regulator n=1 Tax=Parapedobacter pyrenivorans TaxID=1305674 RepID=A0A917HR20_9SPHI|nr:response regulator transcription factor [Parapedobacter pyrenivorans]GGG87623.1 DNA-binding response regulator [Parapedobacter pyrenivorans]
MNILLIEDDSRISEFIIKGLGEHGHTVVLSTSGEEARERIQSYTWDIILMDIMLPGIDGVQLTKLVRYQRNHTPILVLSALDGTNDKVNALDSGADDYLVKPFHFRELISRINALVRRKKFNEMGTGGVYQCANLTINVDEYAVYLDHKRVELSPKEYKLLLYLFEHKNKVQPRTRILNAVWGIDYDNNTNVVDVYISYLRAKLENGGIKFIQTVKGAGYLFKDPHY